MRMMDKAIFDKLVSDFETQKVRVINESHEHAGHRHGGLESHFAVEIVSTLFDKKSLVQRHRMVYNSLQTFLDRGVHALKIIAKTPQEQEG